MCVIFLKFLLNNNQMERPNQKIKIVLADDHEIFRDGFTAMIKKYPEIELIGEAADGVELIDLVRKLKPDIALTDIKNA